MTKIQELKQELKALAAEIKTLRQSYKQAQRDGNLSWELIRLNWQKPIVYREKHIAYCMLRGTPYILIEPKVHEGNEPNWKDINAYMEQYSEPKTLCDHAG